MADTLGDRMKELERVEAARVLTHPICIRLDGRNFSMFTHGLRRPYDERLSSMMVDLTRALVTETGASIGYTQSDEISLVLLAPARDPNGCYFGCKAQKLASITAAFASAWFTRELCLPSALGLPTRIPERAGYAPLFDSRAWSVPTESDAAAVLLWRELDARKNAYTMAASTRFSHKQLLNKTSEDKARMLREVGVDFDAYPAFFRRGTFIVRLAVTTPFTAEEIEALPSKHQARTNPSLVVTRNVLRELDLPPLASLTNRADALFHGAAPMVHPTRPKEP